MRFRLLAALVIGALPLSAALVHAQIHKPIISQIGKIFSPGEVSMPLGATMRVDNDDNVPHSLILTRRKILVRKAQSFRKYPWTLRSRKWPQNYPIHGMASN